MVSIFDVTNRLLVLPYLSVDFRDEIEHHIAKQIGLHAFTTDLGAICQLF